MAARRPLYLLLEVPNDATQEDIRRAYKRLALQHHPDRAGPEGEEKFKQILAAYTLLSDPEQREVYDRFGEEGLSNMEAMPAMAEAAQSMSKVNFFRLLFGMGMLMSALCITLAALVAVRLDGKSDISWQVIVIPGDALLLIVLAATVLSMYFRGKKYLRLYRKQAAEHAGTTDGEATSPSSPTANRQSPTTRDLYNAISRTVLLKEIQFWVGHVLLVAASLSMLLAVASLARGEDIGRVPWSWWAVFSPMLGGNILSLLSLPLFRTSLRLVGVHYVSPFHLTGLNLINVLLGFVRSTQIVMLVLQLEGTVNFSLEVLAIPAYVYCVFGFLFGSLFALVRTRSLEKCERELPYMTAEEKRKAKHQRGPKISLRMEMLIYLIFYSMVLSGVILTTLAAKDVIDVDGRFSIAFIPFFLLFSGFFLVCAFLFTCFTIYVDAVAQEERERQQNEQNHTNTTQHQGNSRDNTREHDSGCAHSAADRKTGVSADHPHCPSSPASCPPAGHSRRFSHVSGDFSDTDQNVAA